MIAECGLTREEDLTTYISVKVGIFISDMDRLTDPPFLGAN